MKVLGIDYGKKNIGFAIGTSILGNSSTFFSESYKNQKSLILRILKIIDEWEINELVIGLPLNMDDSESEMSKEVREFSKILSQAININIHLVDERLTTVEAKSILKEQNKKTDYIDKENHGMAAKLIVDSFLREKR
ncbi:MAG: Holliday junction resolvase RuvX [Gammaproteobacteria bacterium]